MTLLELIQKTTAFFEKSGVPNPRLDIELLLAHVLQLKRMELYLQFERTISETELDILRPLVRRRASREPLQHILGYMDFCGLKLTITNQALIPRPETEILVQLAIRYLDQTKDAIFLDLGTGTGAIALAVLQACPGTRAVATDISSEALTLAKTNAEKAHLQHRIQFRQGNLFEPLLLGEAFDMVISNPPYIPSHEIQNLQKEVHHDPVQSLDGGSDGLDIIRILISRSKNFLKKEGRLLFEMGYNQSAHVRQLLEENHWVPIDFHNDLQGIPRFVSVQRKD